MDTTALVSVEEYLSTVYDPDVDYVDGVIEERNLGEQDHSWLQGALIAFLFQRRRQLGINVYPEQRVQVGPRTFRIPDICVVLGPRPSEQIFTHPPFLCVEILSPEDRMTRILRRTDDYLKMGVQYVWIIEPSTRKAFVRTPTGTTEVKDGVLRTANPEIIVPLAELSE